MRFKEKNIAVFGHNPTAMQAILDAVKREGAKTIAIHLEPEKPRADFSVRVFRSKPESMEGAMAKIRTKVSHHIHGVVNTLVSPGEDTYLATPSQEWRAGLHQLGDLAWATRSQVGKMLEVGGGAIVNLTETGSSSLGRFVRDAAEDLTDAVKREYGRNLMRMNFFELTESDDWLEKVLGAIADPEPRRF